MAFVLVFLLLVTVFGAGAARAAVTAPKFCAERIAHDFGKRFEGMPPQHPPPRGELPFGPRNLAIYRVELGGEAVLAGHRLGYLFAAKDEGRRSLHLDWDIDAVLWRVDRDGRKLRRLEAVHRRVGQTKEPSAIGLVFPAAEPGLYRIEIRFKTLAAGRPLGAYSEYVRVVRRIWKPRLVLGRSAFLPGETAFVQARNAGTLGAIVPMVVSVERWTGSEWVTVKAPEPTISERGRWWIGIGEAAPCYSFRVPADAPTGSYRFAVMARAEGSRKRYPLRAGFRVGVPSPAP